MPDYHVTWEIDIVADTPREAAVQALEIQRRAGSATVFDVHDGKESVRIDLDEPAVSDGEPGTDGVIVPIRGTFESMAALLARIAEDKSAMGFIGVVLRNDGDEMIVTSFNASRAEIAFAALMLQRNALDPPEG